MKRVSSLINIGAFHFICILFMVNAHCTSFEFPTVDESMTYRVPLHSPVYLPFKLNTTSCTNVKGCRTFSISSQGKAKTPATLVCTFYDRFSCNHFCVTPVVSVCGNEKWYSSINLTIETSNVTLLKWSCHDTGIAPDTFINFAFESGTTRHRGNNQTREVSTIQSSTASNDDPVDNDTTSSAYTESDNRTLIVAVESSTDELAIPSSTNASAIQVVPNTAEDPSGAAEAAAALFVGIAIAVISLSLIIGVAVAVKRCKKHDSA